MRNFIFLTAIGLRASYFMACAMAFFSFGGAAFYCLKAFIKRRNVPVEEMLPIALWLSAIGGIVFVGKRVILAIFLHQKISLDVSLADTVATSIGLFLLIFAEFWPVWCKAKFNKEPMSGEIAAIIVAASGLGFSIFYGITHHML